MNKCKIVDLDDRDAILITIVNIHLLSNIRRNTMSTTRAINKLEAVGIGGTTQWVLLRGRDTSNPVLLLIQQGPGLPMINEAGAIERNLHLEEEFVVAYWDQRACGKSFRNTIPAQSMTIDQ